MEFYPYPPGKNISPFEPSEEDNYFVYCTLFSYLGNYEEFGTIDLFDDRNKIFWGAWVLNIFKRNAVIQKGKITFTNLNFDDGHIIGKSRLKNRQEPIQYAILTNKVLEYDIPSWRNDTLKTHSIQDENNPLQLKLFVSLKDAMEYAINFSKENDMDCIVAQWFADIDRR